MVGSGVVEGVEDELTCLESDGFVLVPEMRPAIAKVKIPIHDEDGFVTHHELREFLCAVHTLQSGRGGWVCEMEDGTVRTVPYEGVKFIDGEED